MGASPPTATVRPRLVPPASHRSGRYRNVNPAWNDANLRDLTRHIESPLFVAHIRTAIGSPVQQTNCHPFRHGRWLRPQRHHRRLPRRCAASSCWRSIPRCSSHRGLTDSETLLYRPARTYGLEHDPLGALEHAVGFVETHRLRRGSNRPCRSARTHRWRAALGCSLLRASRVAVALRVGGRRSCSAVCTPRARGSAS